MAWWVVIEHAVALGGYRDAPHWIFYDRETIGMYCLAGFFVLSGYLIYASRLNTSNAKQYFWRRFLRMFPGYWVCLLVIALVIAPLSQVIARAGSYDWGSGIGYVVWNSLLKINQLGIDGTLTEIRHPGVWNFSAWTLFWEFLLYIGLSLVVTFFGRHRAVVGLWLGLAAMAGFKIVLKLTLANGGVTHATETPHGFAANPIVTLGEPFARLGCFFFMGALLYHYRDRVRMTPLVVAVSAVVTFVLAIVGWLLVVGMLPFAIVLLRVGASPHATWLNHPNDYSYGTYIYAFPITQTLAVWELRHPMSQFWFCVCALVITAIAAWLSWHLVEKRALKLKNVRRRRRVPEPGVP